jgi:hypothetical protein
VRSLILLGLSLLSNVIEAQLIHGSYSILAICDDGIMIAADSRSAFVDIHNNNEQLAYYDTTKKVFKGPDFIISCIGTETIGGKTMEYYMNEFNSKPYIKRGSIDSTLDDFIGFIKIKNPKSVYDLNLVQIFMAKYIKIPHKFVYMIGIKDAAALLTTEAESQPIPLK